MRTAPLASNFSGRIPELDGLRGVAIAMVLLFHYFQQAWVTRPGSILAYLQAAARLSWSGVDLFFVLSGFLIGGILLDARNSTNYFRVFYARRFFRIVPIYAAILLVFPVVIFAARGARGYDFHWLTANPLPWYAYWSFTQNFWMVHAAALGANSLAITWSLAVEEQFYLTLPLLVRVFGGRRFTACVLIGIGAAPLLRIALRLFWHQNWFSRSIVMPCRADALLLGVLAAILLRNDKWRERIQRGGLYFAIVVPTLLIGAAYLTVRAPTGADPLLGDIGFTWLALFYTCVLFLALTRRSGTLGRALRMRWLGWLGSIAYGAYLMHQMIDGMVFGILWRRSPLITDFSTLATKMGALVLTLVIAWLSWRYFESPLVRVGHRACYKFAEPGAEQKVESAKGLVCS